MSSTSTLIYIKELMDIFYNSIGIPCTLTDDIGNVIYSRDKKNNYCEILNETTLCMSTCQQEHLESNKQAKNIGEAYIAYCHAGLIYYTVSIDINNITGAIWCGPIHMSDPDIAIVEQIIEQNNYDSDTQSTLIIKYRDIPIVSPSTARYQLKLLNILASDINKYSHDTLRKNKELLDEQRSISENLQEMKFLESLATSSIDYPIHLEKELSEFIIKGSESESKAILNELLGYIFFKHSGDNRRIITMSIELLVIMSRAALDGGARYEDISNLTSQIYDIVLSETSIEEICIWLTHIVDRLILLVFPLDTNQNSQKAILRRSIMYINKNIQSNITLEEVSSHVSLSPTYFSKVFADEMGMTFIEYYNNIRIQESKKFLADNSMTLSAIATKLGFNDQSYFTKVFKKHEGITPGKYRKQNF